MGAITNMTYLRVRELAVGQGMNISDLHMKTGLSYSTVHAFWHNRVEMYPRSTLDKLAIALGVRVPDLFGGDPELPAPGNSDRRRRRSA